MGIGSSWERIAPAGSGMRRGAPFTLAAVIGALFGGLAVAAFAGDDDPVFAAPPPGFEAASEVLPGAPAPPSFGGMVLPPRPYLQDQALQRAPGPDPLTECFIQHGAGPRPQSGPWPRGRRPSVPELRRATEACLDRTPPLPVPPTTRRGG